jgi:hypothetical protein
VLGTFCVPNFLANLVNFNGFVIVKVGCLLTVSSTALINYLATTYLPWRHEFALHHVKSLRNYGIMATSRVESAHRAIKRFLKNRLSSLDRLYEVIRTTCADQRAAFIAQSAKERTQFAPKYRLIGRLFQDLLSKVSFKALELIWKQYRLAHVDWIANRKTGDAFATCTKAFTTQWGLPCKHFIRWLLQGGEEQGSNPKALSLVDDIDKHWWLNRDGSDGLTAAQRAEYGI